ncbi:hypothetical protein IFT47_26675 [Pseudomonas sp. CFBP 13711]|uniref:hypothetical protein n=1 Tax=unclassified Pseudomonas TaxID=196821 RepID=UPI00177F1D47|nr:MULTISPECIES: hypothetical protein [unclassified Pseudomonas]MBD8710221.1 hypothetical protein [Pseudomonas sp. CFBP 13711]MBD8715508.1 hypothetical protein [Pseudomonas sp. CFBP 13715]
MIKALPLPLLFALALGLTGCEKSSEDHTQDANKHQQASDQKQVEGNPGQAADEKAQADKDYAKAHEARASEDRHQAPSLAVPGYIKAPEKN